jgi:hypothetical protein
MRSASAAAAAGCSHDAREHGSGGMRLELEGRHDTGLRIS